MMMMCGDGRGCMDAGGGGHLQVPVSLSVEFRKINGIDTIHDRFSADVIVQASWREPRLDHAHQQVPADYAASSQSISKCTLTSINSRWGIADCDKRDFVCLFASISVFQERPQTSPIFCVHVSCRRGSVIIWQRFSELYTSGLVDIIKGDASRVPSVSSR